MHLPVLLAEVITFFQPVSIKEFIDGTLGAGGHALALLEQHPEIERYYGIDQDPTALNEATLRLREYESKVGLLRGNYAQMADLVGETAVDGILLDIGVSSMQLDQPEKGFSFRNDGPLDMRMDPNNGLTAAIIVNEWPSQELERIFRDYGEEPHWRQAAKRICAQRHKRSIVNTQELVAVLEGVVMGAWKRHPATRVFQALRIAVNDELNVLTRGVTAALKLLRPGGRLAVITFHSLEDRIVKQLFQEATLRNKRQNIVPSFRSLSKKPVPPSLEEMRRNPRSRSAKLRGVEKL